MIFSSDKPFGSAAVGAAVLVAAAKQIIIEIQKQYFIKVRLALFFGYSVDLSHQS